MNINLSTPIQAARFLVRLGIYQDDQIETALVKDYPVSPEEARAIVADAKEFDRQIDA